MRSPEPLFAVTHCHTRQSNNQASPMDELIRAAVGRVTGRPATGFSWSESLTTAEDIGALLHGRGVRSRVDLVLVTDHVNEKAHEIYPDLADLAGEEPRVAIGAELQTIAEDPPGSGRFRSGPEVLVYGGPDRVRSRGGWHHGINDRILAEVHARCCPPGERRPELHRVLAYLREEGLAHALPHPLDGHGCGLRTTLRALAACRFLETVNGGFSGGSAARLGRYIDLHNALTLGMGEGEPPPRVGGRERAPEIAAAARWLLAHLRRRPEPGGLDHVAQGTLAWAGSDAHNGSYDRIRIAYRPRRGRSSAGMAELLADMVATPSRELLADHVFTIVGRPARLYDTVSEVLRLLARNAHQSRDTFRGWRSLLRLTAIGPTVALREILGHRRRAGWLGAELDGVLAEAAALRAGESAGQSARSLVVGPAVAEVPAVPPGR